MVAAQYYSGYYIKVVPMIICVILFFYCLLQLSSTCLFCAGGGRQGQSIKPGLKK